ncbi:MAG: hypothetical protein WCO57_08450 [Verrucomicrobiota bacterium]
MDPTRDNPIIRCNTCWWTLWTFLSFAVVLAAILIVIRQTPTSLEDAAAVARYVTKDKILKAEAAALSGAQITAAIPIVAAELSSSKPTAVDKPEQVVPGSPTALKLATEPTSAPAPNEAPATPEVVAPMDAPATAEPPAEVVTPPVPEEVKPMVKPALPAPEKAKPKGHPSKPASGKARP